MKIMQLKLSMIAVCSLLLQAGCSEDDSPPRAAVQGTVLLDEQPLRQGIIRFVPQGDTQGPKISAVIEAGKFSLPEDAGPWVGTHKVEIESTDDGGLAPDDETIAARVEEQGFKSVAAKIVTIHPIYNRASRLTAEIKADEANELEYKLKSKPELR